MWPYRPYTQYGVSWEQILRNKFNLTRFEAKALLVLFEARGGACMYWHISEQIGALETSSNIRSLIKHIRRKIGDNMILCRRGKGSDGFRLSPECLKLLGDLLHVEG